MNNKKKKLVFDFLIGIGLVVYICLTTLIFVNHKKIQQLKKQGKSVSTVNKEKQLLENLRKNEEDHNSRKRLAQNYYQQGNAKSAVNHYEKILIQEPSNIEVRFKLAVMLYSKRDNRAIEHFKYILQNNPEYVHNASIRNWMKELQSQNKKEVKVAKKELTASQSKALKQLKKMLKDNPNHPNKEQIQETIRKWENEYP